MTKQAAIPGKATWVENIADRGRSRLKQSIFLIAAAFSASAAAQSVPRVGEVLESVRDLRSIPSRPGSDSLQFSLPPAEPEAHAVDTTGQARVTVTDFAVRGATVFSESELLPLVQDGVGRSLTLADIERLAERIGAYYREHGYLLARAYVPAQAIAEGKVEIAVVEGRLGDVRIRRDKRVRMDSARIDRMLAGLERGKPVHGPTLERTLLLLSDMPGVTVRASLQPGKASGTADLVVNVNEGPMPQVSLSVDNFGNRYTGDIRVGLGLDLNDLSGHGDQLGLQMLHGLGNLTSGRVSYEFPLGTDGLRGRLAYSNLYYSLDREFRALDINGDSESLSAGLYYPLKRSRDATVAVTAGLERRKMRERIDAFDQSVGKVVTNASLGLSASLRDDFEGGGVSTLGATVTAGELSRRTESDRLADEAAARSNGEFVKLNWQAARLQRLAPQWSLALSARGQAASKNLESSEQFFLGGPSSVRAYRIGEASGDGGYVATAELRYDLSRPAGVQLIAFVDKGRVRYSTEPYVDGVNHRTLSGAGVGVNWDWKDGGGVRASYATKTDGSSDQTGRDQVWLSLWMPPEATLKFAAAPVAAARSAASSRPVVYGTLDVSVEHASRKGATPAGERGASQSLEPSGANTSSALRQRSNSSSLGFRGRERLGQGLSVWYQMEASVTLDDGTGEIFGRNTGLGMQNTRLGTVMVGKWDAPYKWVTAPLDPFDGRNFASFYGLLGGPGFNVGTATESEPVGTATTRGTADSSFARRQGNSLQYWSPSMGPFSLRLAYSGGTDALSAYTEEPAIFSSALRYSRGGLSLAAAYERHDNYFGIGNLGRNNRGMGSTRGPEARTSSKDDAIKLSVAYDFGATEVALILEKLRYSESGVIPAATVPDLQSYERKAAWVGVTHNIGNVALKASYGIADKGKCKMIVTNPALAECDTGGLGAETFAAGVEYNFSRRTRMYVQYAQIQNGHSASYNFSPGAIFGGAGVGSDPHAFGIGMIHRF